MAAGPADDARRGGALFHHVERVASHQEHDVGALTSGRRADLIVCSDDVFTCPEARIKDIVPLVTVVGGEVAYRRRSADADFMEDP